MKKNLFLLAIMSMTFIACERETVPQTDVTGEITGNNEFPFSTENRGVRPIILGKQKNNPYSVENMLIALDTLRAYANAVGAAELRSDADILTGSLETLSINATDLYVRFLPQDSIGYAALKSDSTLELFNYPLDYEIVQTGDYYDDPSIGDNIYTWLYAVVKPGYQPPQGVIYEVLEDLFIVENSEGYTEETISEEAAQIRSSGNSQRAVIDDNLRKALVATTFYTNSDYWGKAVLNNAIYDYMNYATADGINLPPSSLDIANKESSDLMSSAPLLKNHFDVSLVYAVPYWGTIATFIGYNLFGWSFPDLILRYNKNLDDYNRITAIAWHELTHASQLQRMKREKNYLWASDYWSHVVLQEARNYINTGSSYGGKGGDNWQIIALAEGWANYREEYMARMYLQGASSYEGTDNPFLIPYVSMFRELKALGCSFTNMEKSLCTYSISGFRDNLISKYPSLRNQITNVISSRL